MCSRNTHCRRLLVLALAAPTLLCHMGVGGADTLTFSGNIDYSMGRYGDVQSTNEVYEALTGKYEFGSTLIRITLPFIWVTGPSNVVPGYGSISKAMTPIVARKGLGDILAAIDEDVTPAPLSSTNLDVIGKIKFGTASSSHDLGTGENDYYLQGEWTQHVTPDVSTILDFGRRFTESPAETGLRDVWYGTVGTKWWVDTNTALSGWLDLRQSSSETAGAQIEATVMVARKLAPGWKLTVYGGKGFASGSPTVSGGLILESALSL